MKLLEKLVSNVKNFLANPADSDAATRPSKSRLPQFVARCEGETESFFVAGERLLENELIFRTRRALIESEELTLDVLLPGHGLLKIQGHVESVKAGLGGYRGLLKLGLHPHQKLAWQDFCHREQTLHG